MLASHSFNRLYPTNFCALCSGLFERKRMD